MQVTFQVPDDLAARLGPLQAQLPRILELGFREFQAISPDYAGLNVVLEALATLPSPEEVFARCPSVDLQTRVEELLRKNGSGGLSEEEQMDSRPLLR